MALIPEHIIDDIQGRIDIAELIGRYVPLKRAGRHFKAACPFHKEKTPSFMVNTDKQIFHCFGCGVGGNIFSFLMQHDRLTFPEAVKQLAEHAGVEVPAPGVRSGESGAETLVPLMEKACRYYERCLSDAAQGQAARGYLETRGVSEETRKTFRLGVAPAGWDHLLAAAKTTGVSGAQLETAGLAIQGKSGPYDRFRNRLIFPIMDARGRVVGFGGRSLDGQEPKYLNSPETALYSKGRQLYGLAQAKDAVIKAKVAIIVEGYFDCVVLSGRGFVHVVSPLGTALTSDQAKLLKRYAERVILAFDPDAAGEQATLRGIDLLVEAGLQVQVAQLPDGKDPDECVRVLGRERFEQLLERSVSLFEFLVGAARRRFPGKTIEHKVQAAQFVLPTIAQVPDAMLRSEYVRLLAERLQLDEAAVAEELAKAQPRGSAVAAAANRRRAPAPVTRGPERLLTALILDEPVRWKQMHERLSVNDVRDPMLRRILSVVGEIDAQGRSVQPAQVVSRLSEHEERALLTELVEYAQSVPSKPEAFEDCLRRLSADARKRQLAQLREQIQTAQVAGQDAEAQRLLGEYQQELATYQGG